MRTSALLSGAALALVATPSLAQEVHLNEIYASHSGTDNLEYIELIGTPGMSLDNHLVLIVEGQLSSSAPRFLDRVWDLTGNSIPGDGYFVLGNTAEPATDFDIGASNAIENGTETIYLVSAADPSALAALLDTDVDADMDGTTDIPGLATIIDLITPTGDLSDLVFDGSATVGPDGTFFPAGIFRDGDYPNDWCMDAFLDFDVVVNLNQPRTPGSSNVPCPGANCGDGGSPGNYCLGTPFSTGSASSMSANSLSVSISANNLVLMADNLPSQPGQFVASAAPVQIAFQNGFLCVDPNGLQRLLPITTPNASGDVSINVDFVNGAQTLTGSGPVNVLAGTTHYYQRWNRDPGVGTGSNLSDGIAICMQP